MSKWMISAALVAAGCTGGTPADAGDPPAVGDAAPAFALKSLRGGEVELADLTKKGPVALVVLRGFPGYQCPICSRQVGSLLLKADEFKQAGATVALVYPGPPNGLAAKAKQFFRDKTIPDHFVLLTDPGYSFTNKYNLRWDRPRETAYPSAFVIGTDGKVKFAKVSKTHGGRVGPAPLLAKLKD